MTVRYDVRDRVAEITIDRPGKLNAFDLETVRALRVAAERARDDAAARAVLLAGAGSAFTAGGDVDEMIAHADDGERHVLALTEHHHPLVETLLTMPKPVVVSVDGVAAGGGFGLALCGDYRIGSERTRFKAAYFGIGVVPDGGITWLLPRLVGASRAQQILYLDRVVCAEEALAIGLLHRVVAADAISEEARSEARAMASLPAFAFAGAKELLNASLRRAMRDHLAHERRLNGASAGTEEFRERVRAFRERRPRAGS